MCGRLQSNVMTLTKSLTSKQKPIVDLKPKLKPKQNCQCHFLSHHDVLFVFSNDGIFPLPTGPAFRLIFHHQHAAYLIRIDLVGGAKRSFHIDIMWCDCRTLFWYSGWSITRLHSNVFEFFRPCDMLLSKCESEHNSPTLMIGLDIICWIFEVTGIAYLN